LINKIHLKNIRIYDDITLNINNNLVILVGPNACGKTTILESIYLISKAKSHKTNNIEDIIKENNDFGVIEINDNKKYKMIISLSGKQLLINNVVYKKISDFIGNIKTIMFSPFDLNLVYGTKSERRQFLNTELSIINKNYIYEISKYNKILKERNEILKNYNEKNKTILDIITLELIETGKKIYKYREDFINNINNNIKKIHNDLYGENLYIKYVPSVKYEDFDTIYKERIEYDIFTKSTSKGIHRDDFMFIINDNNAISYSSQGQVRSIVLSLKISLFYYMRELFGNNIILLLDDVFSELDNDRILSLVKFLINENQTFITTTSIDLIPNALKNKAQIIYLKKE
jgi:DNA replication and repair protein RecF